MRVFVLLFNAGTENEGIHTVCLGDYNTVLMFEDEDDAARYAMLLEAQDFPTPTVEVVEQQEVEEFCQGAGYDCRLIPRGFVPQTEEDRFLLAPPQRNLEDLDWQADGQQAPEEIPNTDLEQIRRRLEGLL